MSVNNKMASECEVCYSAVANCKLVCGHKFCKSCVKSWYLKAKTEVATCPMCRRMLYFKGLYKTREQWDEEAYESKTDEIVGEAIDERIQETFLYIEALREWVRSARVRKSITEATLEEIKDDMVEIQKTTRYLKAQMVHENDIDWVLNEGDYYSDKTLNKKNLDREVPLHVLHPPLKDRPKKQHGARLRQPRGRGQIGKRAC